jgi:hypothetical protein
MPLRKDIDGDLVWVTKIGEAALVLEEDYSDLSKFWVKLLTPEGNVATQTRYDTLRLALAAFIEALPINA